MNANVARPSLARSYMVAAMLAGVYSLSFLDRQLLAILAEPIKLDLRLSDTELGMLSGLAFALFYATFGIPIAWLADRTNRVWIVAGACALWSAFTACCGLTHSFAQIALARIGVGVGEAGGSPPSYSIISDYFPAEKRGGGLAVYTLGVPVGTTAGAAVGGWIAAHYGWRAAFMAIGVVGIVYSLVILAAVPEPERGRLDASPIKRIALGTTLRAFIADQSIRITTIGACLCGFVGYAMLGWTPAFLMRTKGMTLGDLALYYSLVSGIAAAIGTLASGFLVDRLGARDRRMYGLVPAIAFLFSIPFYIAGVLASSWQIALLFLSVPFACYATYFPSGLAIIQNGMAPAQRSTASAVFLFSISVIGLGGGPLFIGMISDALASAGHHDSLQLAMLALSPVFLLAALAEMAVARVVAAEH